MSEHEAPDALDVALMEREKTQERATCASTVVDVSLRNGSRMVARAMHRVDTPEGKRGKYYRWSVSAHDTDGDTCMLGQWDCTVGQAQFRMETVAKWSAQ